MQNRPYILRWLILVFNQVWIPDAGASFTVYINLDPLLTLWWTLSSDCTFTLSTPSCTYVVFIWKCPAHWLNRVVLQLELARGCFYMIKLQWIPARGYISSSRVGSENSFQRPSPLYFVFIASVCFCGNVCQCSTSGYTLTDVCLSRCLTLTSG